MAQYWLLKSEPDTYSIDDLAAVKGPAMWEGCRNYTVRNFLREDMKDGDEAFFYHSSCTPAGIVGTMKIVGKPYPDPTQWDPKSEYYDEKSPKDNPRWTARDVVLIKKFARQITIEELRSTPGLESMTTLRKGNRLSVTPITEAEWRIINGLQGI